MVAACPDVARGIAPPRPNEQDDRQNMEQNMEVMSERHKAVFGGFLAVALALGPSLGAQEPAVSVAEISLDSLLNLPVSSASRYAQTTKEAAASVTIISSEEIASFGYRTLFEVLTTVRGFYGSNDRNYSYLGLRGFSRPTDYNNRILLMLDGHVVNENHFAAFYPGLALGLQMEDVERIEVVRGPSSSVYGASAVLGIINVITRMATASEN